MEKVPSGIRKQPQHKKGVPAMHPQDPLITASSYYFVHTPGLLARKLYLYPVCLGDYTYRAGYCLTRSHFDNILVLLVTDGFLTLTQGGHTYHLSAGMAALLDCRKLHHYETDAGCRILWMHFDGILAENYYTEILERQGTAFPVSNLHSARQSFLAILKPFLSSEKIGESELSLRLTRLLELLLNGSQHPVVSGSSVIAEACTYINNHFPEPVPLALLARQASLDPCYFTRLFHRETGMSPHQYLLEARMACARYLLKSTDLPVKTIALRSGFSSESHFCSCFKKREHLSPSAYRNQC